MMSFVGGLGSLLLALSTPPCALHGRPQLLLARAPQAPLRLLHASPVAASMRCRPPLAKLFEPTPLIKGEEYDGLISKITDYGFFVKIGHEQHMGLVSIRTLSRERLPRAEIMEWIEREVGPVGSKVVVEVLSLEFKGEKRTSLRLKDVLARQHMEDLVVMCPRLKSQGPLIPPAITLAIYLLT